MNNIETVTIYSDDKEITLYTLLEIRYNDKNYLFYLKELKENFDENDVYIGEIAENNQLIPINESLISVFENILKNTINKIKNKKI